MNDLLNSRTENNDKTLEKTIIFFSELFNYTYKKKLLIVFIIILFISIGITLSYTSPSKYKSTTRFIPPGPELVATYSDALSTLNSNSINLGPRFSAVLKDPNQIFLEIINSYKLKAHIIKKFDLMSECKCEYVEDAFKYLDKIVKAQINNGLIEISVITLSPTQSQNIAKEYLNELQYIFAHLSTSDVKATNTFLLKRITEVHNKLLESFENIKNFQINNKVIDVEKQSKSIIDTISSLQTNIIIAESELSGLKEIYTDNSPKVRAAQSEIDNLKSKILSLEGNKNLNRGNKSLTDLPTIGLDYSELLRETKVLEQVYTLLTKEYEISKIKQSKQVVYLKIVDEPNKPERRISPKRTVITLVTTFIGVVLAFLLVILQFIFNKIYIEVKNIKEANNIK